MRQLPPRCGDTLSFDRFSPDVLDLEEKRKSRWKETRKKVECSFRCDIGSNKKNVKKTFITSMDLSTATTVTTTPLHSAESVNRSVSVISVVGCYIYIFRF